ncbi:glycosyltransferase [Paraburkholderia sp. MMS20-SJTR3]|uniref:Glycosyltransferase n=1 Tax=Paraburkholderia sejongensis TaxID=2886946 RepID=A0ABS8JTF0_9BURK|nr:glycosyltransferase [Paraburkholderia sp. MMS20-SJTR3]MCC8393181.1 glycosyltransferase [Paraburkholderia sp. MMS20-SJTR3]
MAAPKISVLLPMYNVEDYVEHCLDSLLAQSCTDFEIIAVDDCSPDRSGEVAARVLAQQSRIPWKLVRNIENKGLAETRKIAALEARGDYVLCVDSDDCVHPDLVRTVLREAQQHDADIVNFAAERIYPDGTALPEIESGDGVITGVEAVQKVLELKLSAFCWNKLVRREIFVAAEHPCGLIFEDICVSVQTLANAKVVRLIPDRLYSYMVRESGISRRFNPQVVDLFSIMDRVEKSTASLPIADHKRLFFRLKYAWAYRAIAFQTAITAPTYYLASPILRSVSEKLRVKHLLGMFADRHLKLSIVMTMLKIHPWIFYCVVRRFNRR